MEQKAKEYDYFLKILLLGHRVTGKSSIWVCFVDDKYDGNHILYTDDNLKFKQLRMNDKVVKL